MSPLQTLKKPFVAIAGLTLVLALSACSKSAPTDTTPATDTTTGTTAGTAEKSTDFNDADAAFAQGMIPHHRQAVEMATIALDPARSAGPKVLDLAKRIQGAQDPELAQMTGWLTKWGKPLTSPGDATPGMAADETMAAGETMSGMGGTMAGMMSADEMKQLVKVDGASFDALWMTMMIKHHSGAIEMSKREQTDGKNSDALSLSKDIITAQQSEIDEMNVAMKAKP